MGWFVVDIAPPVSRRTIHATNTNNATAKNKRKEKTQKRNCARHRSNITEEGGGDGGGDDADDGDEYFWQERQSESESEPFPVKSRATLRRLGRVNVATKDCDRRIEIHARRCHRIKERTLQRDQEKMNKSTSRMTTVVWANSDVGEKESTLRTNKTDNDRCKTRQRRVYVC